MKLKKLLTLFIFAFCFVAHDAKAQTFKDVPVTADYYEAVQWAVGKGMISGYPDGTFKPYNTLTEAQFVKMYINLLPFEGDKSPAPYNDNHYQIAYHYGVPVSKPIEFRNMPIWRGNVARMLVYSQGDSQYGDYDYAANYLMQRNISNGQNKLGTSPKDIFGYNNDLKRYHAVVFLYKMFAHKEQPYLGVKVSDYITLHKETDLQPVTYYEPALIATGPTTWGKRIAIDATYSYEITGNTYEHMTVTYYKGNEEVGHLLTTDGSTIDGHTVGQASTMRGYSDEQYKYSILKDPENNNKIYAVEQIKLDEGIYFYSGEPARNEALDLLLVEITNSLRVKKGLQPFQYDRKVADVAYAHSTDMVVNEYFSHYSLNGLSPSGRLSGANIEHISAGEIITSTMQSSISIINSYMHSSGHRGILLSDHEYIGSGTNYYILDRLVPNAKNTMMIYTINVYYEDKKMPQNNE